MTFKEFTNKLEIKIIASYEQGITLDEAEKLAGEFLVAQLRVSSELRTTDLDARMRKTGVKSIKAAAYLGLVKDAEKQEKKKPTEGQLSAEIDLEDAVVEQQNELDTAEVDRDELERMYNVFGNAHIYFRNLAKGSM